jgi:nitrogenase molybdenum-iron protein alpha/beta subunit
MTKDLRADLSNAENIDSSDKVDIVTGGLKMRANHGGTNYANSYVYLAFGTPIIDVNGRIITGF